MKIEGPGRITPATPAKRRHGARAGGFADALGAAGEAKPAAPPRAAAPTASIDALLSMQGVDDATTGRSRGLAQAHGLLEGLEALRRGILAGVVPAPQLRALISRINHNRDMIVDPQLSEIIAEIDLRARVELAKLGIAL
ncbi:MAG: flagellar assembly protein FliX [Pseudomonadota bacterium]